MYGGNSASWRRSALSECFSSWMLFSFKNKYQNTYLDTYILPPACPTFYVLYGMTKKGCVLVGLPVKGVISGSVGK